MRGERTIFKPRYFRGLIFLVFAIATIAAGVLLAVWLGKFLTSAEFSKFLASQAGKAMEAEAQLQSLRWDGYSALSEGLVLIGLGSSELERLEAKALRAEWNWRSLFQGAWRIENIDIQELSATFRPSERLQSAKNLSGKGNVPEYLPEQRNSTTSSAQTTKIPSFIAEWLPSRFEFGRLDVQKADLDFGQVKTTRNTLSILPVENGHNIEARGGSLSVPGIPDLTIAQCRIRERDGKYFLDDSRAFVPEGGSIVASGNLGKNTRINLSWEGVPVSQLPVPKLGEYLAGISEGKATREADGSWRGSLSISGASIRGLPAMKTVAAFLQNPTWANPTLKTLSADFEWSAGHLTLTHLVIESAELVRIEGSLRIATGGSLTGQLQVGLEQNTLRLLPGARETVFNTTRGGWNWSSVQLGGTLSHPTEDLSSRLTTSIAASVLLKESGKAIDSLPTTTIDTAKDLINIFSPLLP